MIDYAALRAVAAVVQTGSFEKAAKALNVTPSAVSQRIKLLEERLGAVLIVRGTPCTATDKGEVLCRHMESVGMLEHGLRAQLPSLQGEGADGQAVTLRIATNADSLATWFIEAMASFSQATPYLLNVSLDDQDHTAEWLRRGQVMAAVTSLERAVSGCRSIPLGALTYHATASPEFVARYFPHGVTACAIAQAPALTFNQKDRLQTQWIGQVLGRDVNHPSHWLPSTQAFVDAALVGMGWGMNPTQLVAEHLRAGRLVELVPDATLSIPLYWQVNRLISEQVSALTRAVVAAAGRQLRR